VFIQISESKLIGKDILRRKNRSADPSAEKIGYVFSWLCCCVITIFVMALFFAHTYRPGFIHWELLQKCLFFLIR